MRRYVVFDATKRSGHFARGFMPRALADWLATIATHLTRRQHDYLLANVYRAYGYDTRDNDGAPN